jgi:hypothetical protein
MSRSGLTATTRNGYYVESAARAPNATPADLKQNLQKIAFDLGGAANSGIVYTGLQVRAHKVASSPATFAVDIDARDLSVQQAASQSHAEITLMFASFDKQNKMIGHQIQESTATINSTAKPAPTAEFQMQVSIPAQATRVRVVARDAVSGKMGTADLAPAVFRAP